MGGSSHRRAAASPRPRVTSSPRAGMTLYEVVVALAIFLGALAALAQGVTTGSRAATQARLRSEAILRCEQKMAEMVAGVLPLAAISNAAFADDAPSWTWSAQVENGSTPGLLYVIVTAAHSGSNTDATASYSLSRMVRDPQVFVIAEEIKAMNAKEK